MFYGMPNPYNKNVVVMAGHNHYNNYLHFFQFVKSDVLWNAKNENEKCMLVPEWPKRKKLFGFFGGKTRKKRYSKRKTCKKNKKTRKQFLYNPKNPKKSFDVYIDKNPNDTINIRYKTVEDIKKTIKN